MHQKLKEIIKEKQKEIAILKNNGIGNIDEEIPPIRDFKGAISTPDRINLIAEIKFASPSAGMIRAKTDPKQIARIYEEAGASAISLLTDRKFFMGDLAYLPEVKKAVSLPILRKDFIIDEIQIKEAFYYGADAILLIARILTLQQLKVLIDLTRGLGMAALTEVHDRYDLEKAIQCKADIIGINNRDLDSFVVDTDTTIELATHVPDECVLVSESGIENARDIKALKGAGIKAVLIGSTLMKSDDIGAKTREMVSAGAWL